MKQSLDRNIFIMFPERVGISRGVNQKLTYNFLSREHLQMDWDAVGRQYIQSLMVLKLNLHLKDCVLLVVYQNETIAFFGTKQDPL
jgi:hypothetical protein